MPCRCTDTCTFLLKRVQTRDGLAHPAYVWMDCSLQKVFWVCLDLSRGSVSSVWIGAGKRDRWPNYCSWRGDLKRVRPSWSRGSKVKKRVLTCVSTVLEAEWRGLIGPPGETSSCVTVVPIELGFASRTEDEWVEVTTGTGKEEGVGEKKDVLCWEGCWEETDAKEGEVTRNLIWAFLSSDWNRFRRESWLCERFGRLYSLSHSEVTRSSSSFDLARAREWANSEMSLLTDAKKREGKGERSRWVTEISATRAYQKRVGGEIGMQEKSSFLKQWTLCLLESWQRSEEDKYCVISRVPKGCGKWKGCCHNIRH